MFPQTRVAVFLDRPNRFRVRCGLDGRTVSAFLPNPGRLRELLLPGRPVYLEKESGSISRKTCYTAVAVERQGRPILLHTHRTNDVARALLERGAVPSLRGAHIKSSEVRSGRNRFDFLLEQAGRRTYLEVKSCTLAGTRVAMFPDAVTERGARHVRELAALAERGASSAMLFVVHWPEARVFLPDFHTDPVFARTLFECRDRVSVAAVAVGWTSSLTLSGEVRSLEIPWDVLERENQDRGSYLLILHLPRVASVEVGVLGQIRFPAGFYVYVGSAMAGLSARLARHRRRRKRMHWHIDWLASVARIVDTLPIRSSERLECDLARAVAGFASDRVPGFGSSDCSCESHLFRMSMNPLYMQPFHDLLAWFRMDRLAPAEQNPQGIFFLDKAKGPSKK